MRTRSGRLFVSQEVEVRGGALLGWASKPLSRIELPEGKWAGGNHRVECLLVIGLIPQALLSLYQGSTPKAGVEPPDLWST